MRAFLINPTDRTISQLDHSGELKDMRQTIACESVDRVSLAPGLDMWVDDEGHLFPGRNIFEFSGAPRRYAGNGLILGIDDQGQTIETSITIDKLLQIIRWTDLATSGDMSEARATEAGFHMGTPIAQLRAPDTYLIWSNKHARWWAPEATGYVTTLKEAGRYSRRQALEICRTSRGGWDGQRPPPSVPVRTMDAIAAGLEGRFP